MPRRIKTLLGGTPLFADILLRAFAFQRRSVYGKEKIPEPLFGAVLLWPIVPAPIPISPLKFTVRRGVLNKEQSDQLRNEMRKRKEEV